MVTKKYKFDWFRFMMKLKKDAPLWEHEYRTVYTVDSFREEIRQRLAPPKKTKDRS